MTGHFDDAGFVPLNIAVLTVSDTRTEETDKSGKILKEGAEAEGHNVVEKAIVKDDVYQMRAIFSRWIADPGVDVILSTGGTGIAGRDSTPEAVEPLLDKPIEGFGELFRYVSLEARAWSFFGPVSGLEFGPTLHVPLASRAEFALNAVGSAYIGSANEETETQGTRDLTTSAVAAGLSLELRSVEFRLLGGVTWAESETLDRTMPAGTFTLLWGW